MTTILNNVPYQDGPNPLTTVILAIIFLLIALCLYLYFRYGPPGPITKAVQDDYDAAQADDDDYITDADVINDALGTLSLSYETTVRDGGGTAAVLPVSDGVIAFIFHPDGSLANISVQQSTVAGKRTVSSRPRRRDTQEL